MSNFYKINGHGHLLPYPEQIPAFMKDKKIFWIDEDRTFMRQDGWKRPVTDKSFFLNEKLEWMEANDIKHEVILNLSQLYANGLDRETTRDVLRFQNDFNADIQYQYPDKFTNGFVVQPAYLDDALAEIEHCVNNLKLNLMCLPTHFQHADGKWESVATEWAEPVFEMANKYGLAVQIHPYDGDKMIALKDVFWRFHLVWMCAQTADTYHCYTSLGYPLKYPNVRICFAHGNQFGQVNIGRRIQGFEGRPDLFVGASHPTNSLRLPNLFFDTLVHDLHSFRLLVDRQGVSQIVAGLDNPYPLGEMQTVPNCYPGKVIDQGITAGFITRRDKEDIWLTNVARWLYGEDTKAFFERLNLK